MTPPPRIVFAGDRDIAVWVLDFLLEQGIRPVALLTSKASSASHREELEAMCDHLPANRVLGGRRFRSPEGLDMLREVAPDFIVGVHFPHIVPAEVLEIPRHGVLNLHPALLPFNRGWHTPSWAILDGAPIGATLHFMDEGVDSGDIVHQRTLEVSPADTAHALYARLKRLELDVFREAWPGLRDGTFDRTPQVAGAGSSHKREELFDPTLQRVDIDDDLLRTLRALTTNDTGEAAWFERDGRRYRIQVRITEDPPADPRGPDRSE